MTNRGKVRAAATVLVVVLAAAAARAATGIDAVSQPEAAIEPPATPAPASRFSSTERRVEEGHTAGAVLRELGAPAEAILGAAGRQLDRLSVGDTFRLDVDARTGETVRLVVDRDDPELTVIERSGKVWRVRQQPIPYRIEVGKTEISVQSSLWEAATDAGFSPGQIMSLAAIFEYDVDFNTELVKGASFRMVTETLGDEDGSRRVGDIRACVMANGAKPTSPSATAPATARSGGSTTTGRRGRRPSCDRRSRSRG